MLHQSKKREMSERNTYSVTTLKLTAISNNFCFYGGNRGNRGNLGRFWGYHYIVFVSLDSRIINSYDYYKKMCLKWLRGRKPN